MERDEDNFEGEIGDGCGEQEVAHARFSLAGVVPKTISWVAAVSSIVLSVAWMIATLALIGVGTFHHNLIFLVLATPLTCGSVVLGAVLRIWAEDYRRRRRGAQSEGGRGFLLAGVGGVGFNMG